MSGRVVFALTERQAGALTLWTAGERAKVHGNLINALLRRGFLAPHGAELELTDLGRAAAGLAARLAIPRG